MACGEPGHDGNVVLLQAFDEHGFGTVEVEVGPAFLEFAQDDALDVIQDAAKFERAEHAVEIAHGLFEFFQEKDDSVFGVDVDGASRERNECRHVAADEDALRLALDVELVRRDLVLGNLAQKQVAHVDAVVVFAAGLADERAHGAVDAHDARLGFHGVERGDVAEADEPLGVVPDGFQVDAVDEVDGAVAAAVGEDGLDACVLERIDEVFGAFIGGSGVLARVNSPDVLADDGLESPILQDLRRVLDVGVGRVVGGGEQGNLVALLEEGGRDTFLDLRNFGFGSPGR